MTNEQILKKAIKKANKILSKKGYYKGQLLSKGDRKLVREIIKKES